MPQGLLHDHRIAADVWGRLIVSTGSLQLVFSGTDAEQTVDADHPGIIPPAQPHHVVIDGPVSFVVEFHRA